MILTTTNTIEHHKIVDYLGIVSGIGIKYPKTKLSFSMQKYYDSINENIEEIKEEAFQNLKANATKLQANAVVGINLDIEILQSSVITVSVTGTAVKVSPIQV